MSAKAENDSEGDSLWEPTRYENLFRYKPSGTIYARFKTSGKQVRRSTKTTSVELAKRKLGELQRNERAAADERRSGRMLFGEALDEYLLSRKHDPSLKPRSKAYDEQQSTALLKTWPGLRDADARKITREECERWASKFAEAYAPSGYNHTLAILRNVFDRVVEHGVRPDNPARSLRRQPERPKKLVLPSSAEFERFIKEIEAGGSGKSRPCANLVRFLAFSGCRKSEAANVLWSDISFETGTLVVYGDPIHRTKNGEFRSVPMIPEMRDLLQELRSSAGEVRPDTPVMKVRECQKAMDRAAAKIGMARITHHDLRHLFATRCIESGVDIPTFARWLGHKDGGALAMRTYGHLRRDHSMAMAQKVVFFPEHKTTSAPSGKPS